VRNPNGGRTALSGRFDEMAAAARDIV